MSGSGGHAEKAHGHEDEGHGHAEEGHGLGIIDWVVKKAKAVWAKVMAILDDLTLEDYGNPFVSTAVKNVPAGAAVAHGGGH